MRGAAGPATTAAGCGLRPPSSRRRRKTLRCGGWRGGAGTGVGCAAAFPDKQHSATALPASSGMGHADMPRKTPIPVSACPPPPPQELEAFYRSVHAADAGSSSGIGSAQLEFPPAYPTGVLLGCVEVVDVVAVRCCCFLHGSGCNGLNCGSAAGSPARLAHPARPLARYADAPAAAPAAVPCRRSGWRRGRRCRGGCR